MMKPLEELIRPNILALSPYSSARKEYSGRVAHVFLDANENPYNRPFNRYPDPLQAELKAEISKVKNVRAEQIFLGNGSDEAIDLAFRIFCRPNTDNVVAIEPTYGMYKVCADINDVEYRAVPLDDKYQTDTEKLLASCNDNTKIIWLCSPNNPTGNNLRRESIEHILDSFGGIVIVDEAYSDFSKEKPFRLELDKYPNLMVLNTFSKAWGCAAIRLGMAYADHRIIDMFNKVKYPYNINLLTQKQAMEALRQRFETDNWIRILIQERSRMVTAFRELPICRHIYPTDANFFLARMTDAKAVYDYLVNKGIIVRNRNGIHLCDNCLRITIGTKSENNKLLSALRQY